MAIITKKIALVRANGKRYFVLNEGETKVKCSGEVLDVGGMACTHGPDKVFLKSHVTVYEADYDQTLLAELYKQGTGNELPPPKVEIVNREKWVRKVGSGFDKHYELTEYAQRQLVIEGYDMAMDYLHSNPDDADSMLQDMASDAAAYHYEITADGIKEGHHPIIREIAADYIYEGCINAMKDKEMENETSKAGN